MINDSTKGLNKVIRIDERETRGPLGRDGAVHD